MSNKQETKSQESTKNAPAWLADSLAVLSSQGVEEKAFSLFQPDVLLPTQYYATTRRKHYLEPEKKLMLAVLEDAVLSFQNHLLSPTAKGRLLFRETEEWILDKDGDWLFSFDNVCEVLGLNPRYIREGLMRWKERKLTEVRPGARLYHLTPRNSKKNHALPAPKAERQKPLTAAAG